MQKKSCYFRPILLSLLVLFTFKIALHDDSPRQITSKYPDFGHFISLDGMNSIFCLIKYTKYCFIFLVAGCCSKNLAIAQENALLCALKEKLHFSFRRKVTKCGVQ